MTAAGFTPAMAAALLSADENGKFIANSDTVRRLRTLGLCEPRRLRLTSRGFHYAVELAEQDGGS